MGAVEIISLVTYLITKGLLTYQQVNGILKELREQGELSQETVDAVLDGLASNIDRFRELARQRGITEE